MSIYDQVIKFLNQSRTNDLKTKNNNYISELEDLKVKISFGQGTIAKVSWFAFLVKGQSVQNGIYPVFLYYKSINLLILAYGVSENKGLGKKWNLKSPKTIFNYFKEMNYGQPNNYGDSYLFKSYSLDSLPKESIFNNDLNEIINYYKSLNLTINSNELSIVNEENTEKSDLNQRPKTSPLNLILYGPPGTGKTYSTKLKAIDILNEKIKGAKLTRNNFKDYLIDFSKIIIDGQIAFTTFHQSMTYEDFIEGIKPVKQLKNDVSLSYEIQDGIFKKMCNLAKAKPNDNFVLIIDEINRGNVSQIFGELITLIEEDKRKNVRPEIDTKEYETIEVTLPYSKNPFTVPNNLYIVGTMNTADRSVEALDTALRRRFVFEELMPDYELFKDEKKQEIEVCNIKIRSILVAINQRIEVLLDRDHQIGHSYFLNVVNKLDNNNQKVKPEEYPILLLETLYNNIIPLLQEYFYNDYEKLGLVLGEGFVKPNDVKPKFALFNSEIVSEYSEKKLYTIVDKKSFYEESGDLKKQDLENALKSLINSKSEEKKQEVPTQNSDNETNNSI